MYEQIGDDANRMTYFSGTLKESARGVVEEHVLQILAENQPAEGIAAQIVNVAASDGNPDKYILLELNKVPDWTKKPIDVHNPENDGIRDVDIVSVKAYRAERNRGLVLYDI